MDSISRRGFVRAAAGALPVLSVPVAAGLGAAACETARTAARAGAGLDPGLLRALAAVVLPAELGEAGRESAVVAFETWLAAYEPVAEREHGYGTGEITYLGPDPAPGWSAQLQALELEATRRHGIGFAALDEDRRRELVRGALRGEPDRLPAPVEAGHVAVGLIAWWVATPEANDLCHGAVIGRERCRSLDDVGNEPAPLVAGG